MIECSVHNISKSFGANKIFENISFEIKTKEKVGLIGPNGVGKSTVLKILMGKEDCDGEVFFRKGVFPGYLDQIPKYDKSYTGEQVLNLAFEGLRETGERLKKIETVMGSGDDSEAILTEYADLLTEFELKGGYDTEEKLSKVIQGLKIDNNMLSSLFDTLSGGEKTKIILGKILLEEPPLLLLDEPSNHLDLSTMEWLETYIGQYNGAVVIVSHDRYFLDKAVDKIIELSPNQAFVFHGNYSYFVEEKKTRYDIALKAYNQNQKDIRRIEDQIKRYRIWGAMRDSEKMYAQAKQLERKLDKMEKLDKPVLENKKLKLSAKETKRTGMEALTAKGLSKSFGETSLFLDADFNVYYRDSIGILGDNGCGKSTLLKILLGEMQPDAGSVKLGTNLNIGYIAQIISFEDESKNILEYFQYKYNINNLDARNELAKVLFFGDDVFKKISVLSGGEKSRLRLCSLMYENVNFMVLDEPTNHLDIESREILEGILTEFTGTIVFVSHDRYFIKKVAKKITIFEDKKLLTYNGDYEYYKNEIARQQGKIVEVQNSVQRHEKPTKALSTIKENERVKLTRRLEAMEQEIETIEEIIKDIENEMLLNGSDLEKLTSLEETKRNLSAELKTKMSNWELLASRSENMA